MDSNRTKYVGWAKRYTTRALLLLMAIISVILWATCVQSEHTISLSHQIMTGFKEGDTVSIIHITKGDTFPVFYVKNQQLIQVQDDGSGCKITFRATPFTKLRLWLQGHENLLALPGVHE
ncbi:MAG: hypothetical protein AAFN77_23575 [Planctomycetota bacterium]